MKQQHKNLLGQMRRRNGYTTCGEHYGQSREVGEELVKAGWATWGAHDGDTSYIFITRAGRTAIAEGRDA